MSCQAIQLLVEVPLIIAALLVGSTSLASPPQEPASDPAKDRSEKRAGPDTDEEIRRQADAPWWGENSSAAELQDIPSAPVPAAEAPQRQRQMKLLAQKFTGHQFWDPMNTRYELRRLERPLYTYRDEAGGVLEGGLFTL